MVVLCTAAGLALTGFCLSKIFNSRLINFFYSIPLNISFCLLGSLLFTAEIERLSELPPKPAGYICTLAAFPEEKPRTFSLLLKAEGRIIDSSRIVPVRGSVLLYLKKDSQPCTYIPGDIILVKLTPSPVLNRGNPDEFDYRKFMENNNVKYYAIAGRADIKQVVRPRHIKLRYRALIIREKIIDMYRTRGITGDRLALVAAITLGQKSMLDRDQKQVFVKAGIMHIMAVSGLHAVILSLFVFNILFFLKGGLNNLRAIITVIFLWLFAYVTGLTPSVLRATLMYSFITAGKMMRRNPNSINSVLASAFFLMAGRPSVLFDAGFLLSYSAVIFIICFYNDLYTKLETRTWVGDKIWQSAAVTITAQAGTLPLTISLFNRFPVWFLLTNVIIVPLSSLLIIVACFIPMTYPLEFISRPIAWVLGFLTGATGFLTEMASRMPFASIENIGMKSGQALLLFTLVFLTMRYVLNRRSLPVTIPVLALLVLEAAGCIGDHFPHRHAGLVVYNTTGTLNIGIISGRSLHLFTDTSVIVPEIARHSATERLRTTKTSIDQEMTLIRAGSKTILVTSTLNNRLLKDLKPDFVILDGKYPSVERNLRFVKPVPVVIVTARVKSSFRVKSTDQGSGETGVYYMRESGAFTADL